VHDQKSINHEGKGIPRHEGIAVNTLWRLKQQKIIRCTVIFTTLTMTVSQKEL
jgi:hypothetical protein